MSDDHNLLVWTNISGYEGLFTGMLLDPLGSCRVLEPKSMPAMDA